MREVLEILVEWVAMVCLEEKMPMFWLGREEVPMFWRGLEEVPMFWLVELVEDFEMAEL